MGLAYLGAAALFLIVMFWVMRWGWRYGRANGGSVSKAAAFAFAGFLVVYLPVFWNWIPVVLTHRYLCNTDAGFTAYVTPEQWVEQNRSHLSPAKAAELETLANSETLPSGAVRYDILPGLLKREQTDEKWQQYGLNFYRVESRLFDARNNFLLTKRVDYAVGSRDDARLWLRLTGCFREGGSKPVHQENSFIFKLQESIK